MILKKRVALERCNYKEMIRDGPLRHGIVIENNGFNEEGYLMNLI